MRDIAENSTSNNPGNNADVTVPPTFQMFPPASTLGNLILLIHAVQKGRQELAWVSKKEKNLPLQIQDQITLNKNPVALRFCRHQSLNSYKVINIFQHLEQQQQHIGRSYNWCYYARCCASIWLAPVNSHTSDNLKRVEWMDGWILSCKISRRHCDGTPAWRQTWPSFRSTPVCYCFLVFPHL